jgi:hypothetical protein
MFDRGAMGMALSFDDVLQQANFVRIGDQMTQDAECSSINRMLLLWIV